MIKARELRVAFIEVLCQSLQLQSYDDDYVLNIWHGDAVVSVCPSDNPILIFVEEDDGVTTPTLAWAHGFLPVDAIDTIYIERPRYDH